MVLENTDDNVLKAKPLGMEAPYSDWKMSGEDLVDYQDKDTRGLTFVFSVERLSDNEAMRKFVSVYQKPSEDNTGAYVVVSSSPNNANDLRVYEISNTTYGNEPDDPKLFLQKVIEMADDSGMLRDKSDYGSFGMLETAESFDGTPVMDGKGGSSGTAPGTYKPKNNSGEQSTFKGTPIVGNQKQPNKKTNFKTYGNTNENDHQSSVNKNLAKAGFDSKKKANPFTSMAHNIGNVFRQHNPNSITGAKPKETSSPITNAIANYSGEDEKKFDAYHQVNDATRKSVLDPFSQGTTNGKESLVDQIKNKQGESKDGLAPKADIKTTIKNKSSIPKPSELGAPKEPVSKSVKTGFGAVGGLIGGLGNALEKTANGAQVAFNPIRSAISGAKQGSKQGDKDNKEYTKTLLAKNRLDKETDDSNIPKEAPSTAKGTGPNYEKSKPKPKTTKTRKNGKPKATVAEVTNTIKQTNKETAVRDAPVKKTETVKEDTPVVKETPVKKDSDLETLVNKPDTPKVSKDQGKSLKDQMASRRKQQSQDTDKKNHPPAKPKTEEEKMAELYETMPTKQDYDNRWKGKKFTQPFKR